MSTDYTEEDVERATRAFHAAYYRFHEAPPSWESEAEVNRGRMMFTIRAALEAADLYTAGALAMKEGAAKECEGLALVPEEFDAAEIWCLVHAAKAIRALPVPPRGSKI